MIHFADRLAEGVRKKGTPLCVGLDPRWTSLPEKLRQQYDGDSPEGIADAYEAFCSRVLELIEPMVAVVKPQSAFFEACGPAGLAVLQRLLKRAREMGLLTVLDSKRNDIASTATAYADAAFTGVWQADAMTINPYLGRDAVEPFLKSARTTGAGVFVLVRTSNPGAGLFQDLNCEGKPLYHHVGEAVASWTRKNLGECKLGDVGAVVGATYVEELTQLRQSLPEVPFLVPGFGAQGGTAEDVRPAFREDGLGAIVNSSRGVLFPKSTEGANWERAIESACRETAASLAAVVGGNC